MKNQTAGSSTSIEALDDSFMQDYDVVFESKFLPTEVKKKVTEKYELIRELIANPDIFFGNREPYAFLVGDVIYSDDQRVKGKSFYYTDRIVQLDRPFAELDFEKVVEYSSEWHLKIWKSADKGGITFRDGWDGDCPDILVDAKTLNGEGFKFSKKMGWHKKD